MNWKFFVYEMEKLYKKTDYDPDIVVGIAKGGIVPARLLASYLGVGEMYCLTIRKFGQERKLVSKITGDLENKKVLLVEDMLETGGSLIAARKYLESKGTVVKTVCLYTTPTSKVEPDFYLKKINKVEKFPWE
ncbi:MAG: phosphoribosyltransferase [Candidatus Woykebacteria bacterium]